MPSRGASTISPTATSPSRRSASGSSSSTKPCNRLLQGMRRCSLRLRMRGPDSRFPTLRCMRSSRAGCRISTSSGMRRSASCTVTAKVAGAVGVACVAVYGSDDVARAETLGVALQLINIMRDVREDWELGRVYIPQDELSSFDVTEGDISAGRVTDAWRALMTFHAERARAYLQDGLGLLRSLDGRSALC